VPIGRGQVSCYRDTPTDSTPRLEGDDVTRRLAELLTGFAAPVPAILDTLGPDGALHLAPIQEVALDQWSRGSVLLIGDAAHATSPNLAEGAAMALEGGLVLAECLASGPRTPLMMPPYASREAISCRDDCGGLGSCEETIT
jgi:FAD-dependent urate hydroxylase